MSGTNSEAFSNICDGIFKTCATVGLIVSATWAYWEYTDNKEAKRIERSMKYVSSLETKEINNSIAYIDNFWIEYRKSKTKHTDKKAAIIKIVNDDPKYHRNLTQILNHLDEIAYCIEHDICQGEVVFKTKSGLFLNAFKNHYPWIIEYRKETNHPRYFMHLECFIQEMKPDWIKKSELCS
ncbi:DUF4760 domain-containing protein [Terasakiella sp. A23]|uniref:DUF4760 domain-containing protein n=1 Tax=Terasakiella sp. FCG-A23 TaxID=3080561 RepID=UPI0029544FAB|nr:DUF4760 domain-containing protein [Terasakiella sp. A23]MDV7338975.1 DUF4760 domain-containing protein [Terasakiella sp. A23]